MRIHWTERVICALPGFKLHTAMWASKEGIEGPNVAFYCPNRLMICCGPWGIAWLVRILFEGYWGWRMGLPGEPAGLWVSERRELELWRMCDDGRHWADRLPPSTKLGRDDWPVFCDYERGELVTETFPRAILQRCFYRLWLWLRYGEPLSAKERRELNTYLLRWEDRELRRHEALELARQLDEQDPAWRRFLTQVQADFEKGL